MVQAQTDELKSGEMDLCMLVILQIQLFHKVSPVFLPCLYPLLTLSSRSPLFSSSPQAPPLLPPPLLSSPPYFTPSPLTLLIIPLNSSVVWGQG